MKDNSLMRKFFFSPFTRLLVGFIMIMSLMMLGPYVIHKVVGDSKWWYALGILVYVTIALGSYILLYRYYEHRKVTELSFKGFEKNIPGGFAIGFLLVSVVVLILLVLGIYRIEGMSLNVLLLYFLVTTIVAGVMEELLLRGVVFRLLEEKLGTTLALVISAFLFGFMHIINPNASVWAAFAISIEAGVLLAAAYAMTRNLWFPICIHWAWNFTEGYIYGFAVSGGAVKDSLFTGKIAGPEWLTGGTFGPEASMVTVLVCSMASIYFLWRAWKKGNWMAPY